MKNLRKIILAVLVGLVAFSTTGCSVKLVSWQQHKEAVELREKQYRMAYANVYATEYQKAVAEGRIKEEKNVGDYTIEALTQKLKNIVGVSEIKKIEKKASDTAETFSKNKVPSTYFWSWFFIHIVVVFLILLITMFTGIVDSDSETTGFITAATILGGIAIFVIQFLTQNAAFNTHILLLQLVILGAFIITYAAISDDDNKGRIFLATFGPYITTIAILYLNKNTNLFAYPMLISASVWTLFVSGMIISKINGGYEDGAKMVILDSFIAAAVLVLAFVLKNATYFAYIALALIFVISVIRICVSNVKAKKEEAEKARLRAIYAEKQAEEKRIADQKAAEEKAIAEQKAEAERKAALEKAEAERKALEAAELVRKAAEKKAEEERDAKINAHIEDLDAQIDALQNKIDTEFSAKDAMTLMKKAKAEKDKKALEEKRDYILDNWDDVVIDWE